MLETVWQDVRYAFRTLRRSPGFAAVAIGSLAVGVGFAVFIFSFVQQALGFTAVPAAKDGRLVDLFTNQLNGTDYGTSSFPDIESIRTRTTVFDAVVAYSPYTAALTVDGAAREAFGEIVTATTSTCLVCRYHSVARSCRATTRLARRAWWCCRSDCGIGSSDRVHPRSGE